MTAFDRLVDALANYAVKVRGDHADSRCPAHDDRNPSLTIDRKDDRVLIDCKAGCPTEDVLASLGMTMRDLFDEPREKTDRPVVTAAYDYVDENGTMLFQAVRLMPKSFRQRRPDGQGGWVWNLKGITPVLYRLPAVIEAVKNGTTVYIVEGEKDVAAVETAGHVATCNPMGAGKWRDSYSEVLAGADVVIVADRDEPGRKHAQEVADSLDGIAANVRVVEAAEGKDASDHLTAGYAIFDFVPVDLGAATASDETPPDDLDDEYEQRLRFERDVHGELEKLRIRHEARRRHAAEIRPSADPPPLQTLTERLARPRPPVRWRIEDWQPANTRVVLAAQYKSGKTTLVGNLVRCLADGSRWLSRHDTDAVTGTVVLLDFEMSGDQLDDWLRDQGIASTDRIVVAPMRGAASAFDILDDDVRQRWAETLKSMGAEYVILDCLRPILDALGLDEHKDAGRFLVAFDELLKAAGVPDACLVHHMGHGQERSRGDSRIRDWPDVEWRLVRENDEPGSPRYVSAYGRDVDQSESLLHFTETTRHLSLAGGNRKQAKARAALADVLRVLDEKAPEKLTANAIEMALMDTEHPRAAIREAVAMGVRQQSIDIEQGPKNSRLHSLNPLSSPVRRSSPSAPANPARQFAAAFIGGELSEHDDEVPSSPNGEQATCIRCGHGTDSQGHAANCLAEGGTA